MTVRRCLWDHRTFLVVIIAPIILLPLPIAVNDQKGTCGFMLLLMGVYWCTESLPLGVTGLIPVFLAPMFGILTTVQVCDNYLKSVVMMLTGGLIVAIAIEKSDLHRRIALAVLRLIGTRPRSLMFGFMLPTWFLSMWISNTATTAMMLPIMEAVLEQMKNTELSENRLQDAEKGVDNTALELDMINPSDESNGSANHVASKPGIYDKPNIVLADKKGSHVTDSKGSSFTLGTSTTSGDDGDMTDKQRAIHARYNNFCKGMTVAVAYAANVGGTATLTGTAPNTIMKGHADELWQAKGYPESPVSYSSWLIYGIPVATINFIFVYIWLLLFYLGFSAFKCQKEDPVRKKAIENVIITEYQKLGRIRFHEAAVGGMFVILVFLWFFRSPGFMSGWAEGFEPGYIGDAVPAILIAVLMFAIPMHIPRCNKVDSDGPAEALLDWQTVHKKFPWSIIFLMGGGFALAQSCQVSGLSQWIGDQLIVFGDLPDWLMVGIICLLVAMLTEVTSNSATCTILMPIMAAMAESLNKNPLYLMFPTAIATSYAFMLPVATPPNAIAFSYGRISVLDMVKAGAILNVLCVVSITLANQTWGMAYFNLNELPWPKDNITMTNATIQ